MGSLTGAVASQRVTEAPKGTLRLDGNQSTSAIAEACLTVRLTSRTGTKVGNSDPAVPNGRAVAQRIKATLIGRSIFTILQWSIGVFILFIS